MRICMLANNAKDECKLNFKLVYLDYALAIGYNFLQNFVGRSKRGALLWQMY
jgi:hypothetical protein